MPLSMGAGDPLAAFVVVTSLTSTGQWFLLKRYVRNAQGWVFLSGIGAAIGAIFIANIGLGIRLVSDRLLSSMRFGLTDFPSGIVDLTAFVGLLGTLVIASLGTGALVGFFQWLILRGQVRRAELWIIASALGSLLAALLTAVVPMMIGMDPVKFVILNTGVSQGIIAIVTGIALIKLLNQVTLPIPRFFPRR